MATVLVTGGTGLVGSALAKALVENNHHVIVLTRNSTKVKNSHRQISYAYWNVEQNTIDKDAIGKADFIVHLAGANVADGRWTEKRKKEILDSRVMSGELLVKALTNFENKVQAVISASAIGWYGPDPQIPNPDPFKEIDKADISFLGVTCQQWEKSIEPVRSLGKRLVTFRIGIVLSREGGAYAEFKKPLQFGIASILGSGKQVISWIHISDLVQLILFAIQNKSILGVYNAVAPEPVSNKDLIKGIAKTKGGFYITAPVPEFVLKVMLGEMSIEVLKSATVSSKKLEQAGFEFKYSSLEAALIDLNKKAP
jgi:uncharacterized protein (TIGR01777 family)